MKILLLFQTILFSILSFAQTYTFDKLITTELKGEEGNLIAHSQKLINSKNQTYFFRIHTGTGYIQDLNSNFKHEFKVEYLDNDQLELTYLRSCDESEFMNNSKQNLKEKKIYRVEKLNENEFFIGKYRSENAKKAIYGFQLKINEIEEGKYNFLHPLENELMDVLNPYLKENYLIEEIIFYQNGREGNTLKLENMVNYNMEVKLPNQLKLDCLIYFK